MRTGVGTESPRSANELWITPFHRTIGFFYGPHFRNTRIFLQNSKRFTNPRESLNHFLEKGETGQFKGKTL